MKRIRMALTVVAAVVAICIPAYAAAEEPLDRDSVDVPVAVLEEVPVTDSAEGGWGHFWDRQYNHVQQLDPFGLSGVMPAGYAYVKGQLSMAEIGGKYGTERNLMTAFPRFVMKNKAGATIADVDMGLEGSISTQTLEVGYSITDYLTAVISLPLVSMESSFSPVAGAVDANGNFFHPEAAKFLPQLGQRWAVDPKSYSGLDFVNTTLPMLGRHDVASGYTADWLLGDLSLGVNWNLYRSKCDTYPCLAAAINPRLVLPTAKAQDSNNSLLFGTGTAMDSGLAGWAVGSTQSLDVRLFKHGWWIDIVASFQFGARYAFEQEREYPTTYTAGIWPDQGDASLLDWRPFYDVSQVKGSFRYTPGWQLDWLAQLQVTSTIVSLSAGYLVKFNQDQEVKADYNWNMSVRQWGMMGQGLIESLLLTANVNLMPIYVPAVVGLSYNHVLDGYNAIKYDDNFTIMVKFDIPLFPDA